MNPRGLFPAPVRLLALCLLGAAQAGCAKRFVEVVYGVDLKDPNPPAQVVETPRYRSVRTSYKSIAVVPPDSCASGVSLAFSWGTHDPKAGVVPTDCRVWIAELEKAFVAQGYRIVSWQAIRDEARRTNESILRAAARRHADLVLIVNSMTTRDVKAGEETQDVLKFYTAKPGGETMGPEEVSGTELKTIQALVEKRLDVERVDSALPLALAATLDATVAEATTGESIWFYRRIVYRRGGRQQFLRFLLRGRDRYWRPTEAEESAPATDGTGGSVAQLGLSAAPDPSLLTTCSQAEAERTVLSDLVTTFVKGRN